MTSLATTRRSLAEQDPNEVVLKSPIIAINSVLLKFNFNKILCDLLYVVRAKRKCLSFGRLTKVRLIIGRSFAKARTRCLFEPTLVKTFEPQKINLKISSSDAYCAHILCRAISAGPAHLPKTEHLIIQFETFKTFGLQFFTVLPFRV